MTAYLWITAAKSGAECHDALVTTPQVHRFYHHPAYVLDDATVQIGAGGRAVRIAGPAAQTLHLLERITAEHDAAEHDADAVTGPAGEEPTRADDDMTGSLAAHLATVGFVSPLEAGSRAARRAYASVLVDGLCGTGTEIIRLLGAENVGTVVVRDAQEVGAEDIGRGFSGSQRGMNRAQAYARRARLPRRNQALLLAGPQEKPPPVDLYIMVRHGEGYLPALNAQWEALGPDQALLPVRVGEESSSIGPLLTGAAGICAQCLRHQAVAQDPYWEHLAEPAECSADSVGQQRPGVPFVVQTWCAAAAARQALTIFDGRFRAAVDGHALIIDTQTGYCLQHAVVPHPECVCQTKRPGEGTAQ